MRLTPSPVGKAQLTHMRDAVFFEGPETPRKLSRFWVLLLLAAVIAAAGVVADSTATVIGAMIVAPLMTPIQGLMLATVLGDRTNTWRSLGLVVTAAAAVVAIAYVIALLVPDVVVSATNSQVAGRVNPTLLDLVGALATGAVASIALVRRDISDTLPGVAIAISLVPPLSVVGISLEAGAGGQSFGALLLFLTNVTAILAVGFVVMALYGVRTAGGREHAPRSRRAPLVITLMLVLVAAPLTSTSVLVIEQRAREDHVVRASSEWADARGWEVIGVTSREGTTVVRMTGPLPIPDASGLREAIEETGTDVSDVRAEFFPSERVALGDPAPDHARE